MEHKNVDDLRGFRVSTAVAVFAIWGYGAFFGFLALLLLVSVGGMDGGPVLRWTIIGGVGVVAAAFSRPIVDVVRQLAR